MELTPLAQEVLADHQSEPDVAFYDVDRLGPIFRDTDFQRLDDAYAELMQAGLMEKAGSVVSFFGTPRELYRLSEQGREARLNVA
jgi:hypothetical protein